MGLFDQGIGGMFRRRHMENNGLGAAVGAPQPQGGFMQDMGDALHGMGQGLVNPNVQNNLISRGLQSAGNYLSQVPQDAQYLAEAYGPKVKRGLAAASPISNAVASIGIRG